MDDRIYRSEKPAQSSVKRQGLQNYLSSLFGWRRTSNPKAPAGVEFVKVDPNAESRQRIMQAVADQLMPSGKLSSKLEELVDSWLQDTSDSAAEIANRARRVDQLSYATLNDPFIGRVVELYADEATQLDVQNNVIGIETPDPRMTKEMYTLLDKWGITQPRCKTAIKQLATYGDAFWANKVSENGVEKIIPLKQLDISDRLEFNPIEALEKLKRLEGFSIMLNKQSLIKQMIDDLDETGDFADMFDTKLFGFVIHNDLVVPPWSVTHFRANADGSEFTPFGSSPILGCLAPFKLTASTITLQSIARVLNFPVTLYKVKTSASADEARQFSTVNRVREEYDNIGVSPSGGNSEVYTVNTKIWMPDGLMDVDVKNPQVDIGFTNDIEMYQDRVAVATGVPKGYLVQEWGGFGNSAISLTEQFKPFARATFALQSSFLSGLADLFRLHFAINGQFDFNTPFTLSLRYPSEEVSEDKNNARLNSLEMASSVMDLVRAAIGAEDDEGLPPDITRDIISKYTFLDPVDVIRWTRDAKYSSSSADIEGGEGSSDKDFDIEKDLADEEEKSGSSAEEGPLDLDKLDLGESAKAYRQRRIREARIRELSKRYNESRDDIYFRVLQENVIGDFVRHGSHIHTCISRDDANTMMLETLAKKPGAKHKLREASIKDMLSEIRKANDTN